MRDPVRCGAINYLFSPIIAENVKLIYGTNSNDYDQINEQEEACFILSFFLFTCITHVCFSDLYDL